MQETFPASERCPGEGNGNPLQYSCLENPMDGGAWWATVHGVTKSWTRLSDFTFTFNSCLNKVYIPNGTGASSISRLPSAVILLKLKFPALFKYFPSLLMQKPILILVPKFLYDLCPSSSLSAGLHFPLTHSAPQRLTFCFCVQCPRPKFRAFSSVQWLSFVRLFVTP